MQRFATLPPLSLYVHIPWCVRKCPYCDFNSHEARDKIPEQAYVEALLRDLEQDLPRVWGRLVYSIFLGGGTPSLFAPESIDSLLSGIRARLPLDQNIEITLEANPGTVVAPALSSLHNPATLERPGHAVRGVPARRDQGPLDLGLSPSRPCARDIRTSMCSTGQREPPAISF